MPKHTAIYVRVSTDQQSTASQLDDLRRYAESVEGEIIWYEDAFSGKTMDRPGWKRLEGAIRQGRVSELVVWRLDRLGRTASGLTGLFDDLVARKVNLRSLKDGLDLSTPAGRLMANVLASIAQFETEVRGERVRAGQAAAKANGKKWGGSKPGKPKGVDADKALGIVEMHRAGKGPAVIARAFGISRPTVYRVIKDPAVYGVSR